jgi:hypothetical protein
MERELEASRSQDERSPSLEQKSQKLNYPIWDIRVSDFFSKQIEFDYDLRYSLFWELFLVSDSNSYVILPI